jgi:uncharacterized protein YabN with tetrapyrrole methylase and pyrophosphatase domain
MLLSELRRGPGVALVGYGHPLVFDDVCAELRRKTESLGLRCVVLPGISCLDTLCVDLAIDYGDGLQVFDATDLVESRLQMSPALHTLVLQLYEFCEDMTADAIQPVRGRLGPLERYLSCFYPVEHPAILVYSNDGSGDDPILLRTKISSIDRKQKEIFPGVTLYIPPYIKQE